MRAHLIGHSLPLNGNLIRATRGAISSRISHPSVARAALALLCASLVAACSDAPSSTGPVVRRDALEPNAAKSSGRTTGRIVFTGTPDGSYFYDVFTMNPDGTDVTQLTDSPYDQRQPSLSPDGKRIAWVSYATGNGDVYVMNADGTGVMRLTDSDAPDTHPSWSPDGKQLAFASQRDGNYEVYVMRADGTGVTRVTNNVGRDYGPVWSPKGDRIAFLRETPWSGGVQYSEIYTMNTDGTQVTRLAQESSFVQRLSWAPSGKQIVFSETGEGIFIMDADGTKRTQIGGNGNGYASFSPSGKQLVFTSLRDGNTEILTMNADGTGVTRLTYRPGDDFDPNWGR